MLVPGILWLLACCLGAALGWLAGTSGLVTLHAWNWHWRFLLQIALGAGLPCLAAIGFTRAMLRAKQRAPIPWMWGLTLLTAWSTHNAVADLRAGLVSAPVKVLSTAVHG